MARKNDLQSLTNECMCAFIYLFLFPLSKKKSETVEKDFYCSFSVKIGRVARKDIRDKLKEKKNYAHVRR